MIVQAMRLLRLSIFRDPFSFGCVTAGFCNYRENNKRWGSAFAQRSLESLVHARVYLERTVSCGDGARSIASIFCSCGDVGSSWHPVRIHEEPFHLLRVRRSSLTFELLPELTTLCDLVAES
jgi:hypothetical protein